MDMPSYSSQRPVPSRIIQKRELHHCLKCSKGKVARSGLQSLWLMIKYNRWVRVPCPWATCNRQSCRIWIIICTPLLMMEGCFLKGDSWNYKSTGCRLSTKRKQRLWERKFNFLTNFIIDLHHLVEMWRVFVSQNTTSCGSMNRIAGCYIPEHRTLHSHCCENLKSTSKCVSYLRTLHNDRCRSLEFFEVCSLLSDMKCSDGRYIATVVRTPNPTSKRVSYFQNWNVLTLHSDRCKSLEFFIEMCSLHPEVECSNSYYFPNRYTTSCECSS
jgi:hypothetical protein